MVTPVTPKPSAGIISYVKSHAKAFIAYAGVVLGIAAYFLPDNKWVILGVGIAAALGVHIVPNVPVVK